MMFRLGRGGRGATAEGVNEKSKVELTYTMSGFPVTPALQSSKYSMRSCFF
jgi:hypothetical protein